MVRLTPSVPYNYEGVLMWLKCSICQRKFSMTETDYKAMRPVLYCPECSQHLACIPETELTPALSLIRVWCTEQAVQEFATQCSEILGYPAYIETNNSGFDKRKHAVIIPTQVPFDVENVVYGSVIDTIRHLPGVITASMNSIEHENEKKRPSSAELTRKMLRKVVQRRAWNNELLSSTIVFAYVLTEAMYGFPSNIIADETFSSLVLYLDGFEHTIIAYPDDNSEILMCPECYRVFLPSEINSRLTFAFAPCGHSLSDLTAVPEYDNGYI